MNNRVQIYLKLICNQDIQRTPSVNIEAAENFFGLSIKNGESKKIDLGYKNRIFPTVFSKRKTRNEYRFFINRHADIQFKMNDILLFEKESNYFSLRILRDSDESMNNSSYRKFKRILDNSYHRIIDSSSLKSLSFASLKTSVSSLSISVINEDIL